MRAMSSAPVAALVVVLTLVAVLLLSGAAKLRDRRATRDAFTALRVPAFVPAGAAAAALPWIEVGVGVLLLVAPSGWLVPVGAATLALMLVYTALIARALRFEEPVECSCFGSIGRHEVDRTTLARNGLLSVLSMVCCGSRWTTGRCLPRWATSTTAAGTPWPRPSPPRSWRCWSSGSPVARPSG